MWDSIYTLLLKIDYWLWYYINAIGHNSFLDAIVPYFRNQWTWAPLYLFLLIFMPLNFRKKGLMWLVFFLMTFAFSDYISGSLLKPFFHRIRPCNNHYLIAMVHNIVPCGSGYSFPSSHAANHFALAIFSGYTLKHFGKWIWPVALFWAFSVAYAQVYVGVHFPGDVIGGGLLGLVCGVVTSKVYNRVYSLKDY
ncbi:MAG: phosphatase PAP2 family protein [Flavipsychrobacter sp.]